MQFFALMIVKTDMNRFGSHRNQKNRPLYKEPPPQGLFLARRAGSFFEFLVTDPPHRKPCFGAAAFIVPGGSTDNNPLIISEYYDLI